MIKISFIVSHPIQYYVPLYRRLAARSDVRIRVFYTWHAGQSAQLDRGFKKPVAWDIPLTDGYDFELVPNTARTPGTHHYWGLQNPELVARVRAWQPDAVHVTGYAWHSHLWAMRSLARRGLPVLFRGDSHLLNERQQGWRWRAKRFLLARIFSWPAAFLCVGRANKDYYRAFGVPEAKLFDCPHSIETERFAEPDGELEAAARAWRRELRVTEQQKVLLFAGKFEDKKRPVALMEAFLRAAPPQTVLVMVGDGELGEPVRALAARYLEHFRVLPFQNQSRMPLVYRLGDALVLPSAYGETWGLAVNEAMACGRPALVSDRVGCHADVIRSGENGDVFAADDWNDFGRKLATFNFSTDELRRKEIKTWAQNWSIEKTENPLVACVRRVTTPR